MKKVIIIILLLCLVFSGIILNERNHLDQKAEPLNSANVKESPIEVKNIQYDGSLIKEDVELNEEISEEINEVQSFFFEEDLDDVLLALKALESISPISAIGMKKNNIKNLKIGDTFLLPSIDGIEYTLKVTEKDMTYNGDITISGNFYENGIQYSSVITEGKESSFISMMTPEGNFEVEVVNDIGLVYSVADIENARIDYSKKDTISIL